MDIRLADQPRSRTREDPITSSSRPAIRLFGIDDDDLPGRPVRAGGRPSPRRACARRNTGFSECRVGVFRLAPAIAAPPRPPPPLHCRAPRSHGPPRHRQRRAGYARSPRRHPSSTDRDPPARRPLTGGDRLEHLARRTLPPSRARSPSAPRGIAVDGGGHVVAMDRRAAWSWAGPGAGLRRGARACPSDTAVLLPPLFPFCLMSMPPQNASGIVDHHDLLVMRGTRGMRMVELEADAANWSSSRRPDIGVAAAPHAPWSPCRDPAFQG